MFYDDRNEFTARGRNKGFERIAFSEHASHGELQKRKIDGPWRSMHARPMTGAQMRKVQYKFAVSNVHAAILSSVRSGNVSKYKRIVKRS